MEKIKAIKIQYMHGEINQEEAYELATPIVAEMNEIAKGIAKKFGKRHQAFTVSRVMQSKMM